MATLTAQDALPVTEALERDGFALVRAALSASVAHELADFVYSQLERYSSVFRQLTGVSLADRRGVRRYVANLTQQQQYAKQQPELQHLIRGEFPLDVRLSPHLLTIARQPALLATLEQALGCDQLRMHYPPMVRFKVPGLDQANVPLHQDASYNGHLDSFITAWIPLCPITDACGGVDLLVGSHRLGTLEHHEQAVWGNCICEAGRIRNFAAQHVTMRIGDVLLFGSALLHRSHPNRSCMIRCSIDCRFFSQAVASRKHYFDVATQKVVPPAAAA